jgi:hemoglobin
MRSRLIVIVSVTCFSSACSSERAVVQPAAPPPVVVQKEQTAAPVVDTPPAPAGERTLFDRLGGLPAIEAVVAEFTRNVASDERVNAPFGLADLETLRKHLVNFFCAATGGPCKYTGRNMRAAHRNMGVTAAQFDALVGNLIKSLDALSVPEKEKNEILAALGPTRAEIVEIE